MALYDLVRVRVTSTGTGSPLALGVSDGGGRTFSAAGVPDGAEVSYALLDGTLREVGKGIYNAGANTLSRAMSSSTTGAAISLSGNAVLEVTVLSSDFAAAAGAAPAVHTQSSPSAEWTFNHNKGFRPLVEVLSAGGVEVEAEVAHISDNQVKIYFTAPQTGQVLAR